MRRWGCVLFLLFIGPSLAQTNATALQGWTFDDNSRSSWDILWTCLSTIFACTWTALHLAVPGRDKPAVYNGCLKFLFFIGALLAPEFMAGLAAEELSGARLVAANCNAAFDHVENAELPASRWRVIHGFCVKMNGLVLRSKDNWYFQVDQLNVVPLIKSGVIKASHLEARDIEDRAKADPVAKGLTLLQSFWVTCNIIARAGYHLPISPLEISTVAYVACAAATYALWWYKPKDMVTPITIFLPYDHDGEDMTREARQVFGSCGCWVPNSIGCSTSLTHDLLLGFAIPIDILFKKLKVATGLGTGDRRVEEVASVSLFRQGDEKTTGQVGQFIERQSQREIDDAEPITIVEGHRRIVFFLIVGLVFCGIHVAA